MGYKCPTCKKDFGVNYKELQNHVLTNPLCALMMSSILKVLEEEFDKIEGKIEGNH